MADLSYRKRQLLEKKAILSQELLNRKGGDPLLSFDLFSPQREFVRAILQRSFKDLYYIGANRSGKSDAGAAAGARLARFGFEDADQRMYARSATSGVEVRDRATSGWVSALDFPISRDTIQPKYFDNGFVPPNSTHEPFIPKREIAAWRVSDQILKLKNGSIIGFKSADSGRSKYQGAEKDWIHFDEEHPEGVYEESIIRVGASPLTTFTTCTLLPPEGTIGGVTWIYNKIVKGWRAGTLENTQIYNASIYDNPHIARNEIEFLESKYPEGSPARRIRLNGELIGGLGGARVYSAFDPLLNVNEQPPIEMRRPLAWIWDFNVEPMISLVGQREGKLFRIYKEIVMDEGSIPEMCDFFRRFHPYHRAPIWVYGDATGKNRHAQTRLSCYHVMMNSMKDYPVPLNLKVPESNPGVVDRINSVNVALRGPQGTVDLEVDPSCVELIDDLEGVLTDGKQGIKKTTNKKDPYYRRTHTSDALGYWIFQEAPITPITFDEAQRTSGIVVKRPGYSTPSIARNLNNRG